MCPECSGPRAVNAPGGATQFSHALTCGLGKAMDAVIAADADRTEDVRKVTRSPRQVEVDLAVALGIGTPTSVVVERLSESSALVRRTYVVEA